MNILLINHYAGSANHGMEYRPYYLAREWVRNGHSVRIIAADFSHLRSKQPLVTGDYTRENIDGIDYTWCTTPKYQGNGARRVLNMFAFLRRLYGLKQELVKWKPDVVIASSTYPMDIWPARAIARVSGARLVFEVHDLWPLSPMELGGMSRWHPFIMLLQAAENYAYRHSDAVVSMLSKAIDHMVRHGMAPDKFRFIPNGVDVAEWNDASDPLPQEHIDAINVAKDRGSILVGYAGGHGLSNTLDQGMNAAEILQSRNEPVDFIFVGQGPEKVRLIALAKSKNLANAHFLPPIPKKSIPTLLASMDILYLGWGRNPLYRFGICPNKLMDYMMAGKPVVHAVSAANDPVAESGCGITVEPENPQAIADAVIRLKSISMAEREQMGANGRAFVLANHTYPVLAKRFLESVSQGNHQ